MYNIKTSNNKIRINCANKKMEENLVIEFNGETTESGGESVKVVVPEVWHGTTIPTGNTFLVPVEPQDELEISDELFQGEGLYCNPNLTIDEVVSLLESVFTENPYTIVYYSFLESGLILTVNHSDTGFNVVLSFMGQETIFIENSQFTDVYNEMIIGSYQNINSYINFLRFLIWDNISNAAPIGVTSESKCYGISVGTNNKLLKSWLSYQPFTHTEGKTIELTGEYDGNDINVSENGTVNIESLINENKIPLNVNVNVPSNGGSIGTELNIHYGLEAPTDTSKLWVKTDIVPNGVEIKNTFNGAIEGKSSGTLNAVVHNYISALSSCGVVGTKCYIFGGCSDYGGSNSDNKIQCYNTETDTIETMSAKLTLDYGTSRTSCGVVGTKCYIFGGYGFKSTIPPYVYKTIHCYDTETDSINVMSTSLPTWICDTSCGVVGTKCYIFGGYGGDDRTTNSVVLNTIYCYDTINNTTETMSAVLPIALRVTSCGVVGTKCYIFGGFSDTGNNNLVDTIYCYDTETDTLETMGAKLSLSGSYYKGYFSCVSLGTKCYIFGDSSNKIQCYNTETDTIETMSVTLPDALYKYSSGLVGNTCYIFGGVIDISDNTSTAIRYFSLTTELPEKTLMLINGYNKTPFKLIDGVEISIEQAFMGNSDNEAEIVKCAVYSGTEWVELN